MKVSRAKPWFLAWVLVLVLAQHVIPLIDLSRLIPGVSLWQCVYGPAIRFWRPRLLAAEADVVEIAAAIWLTMLLYAIVLTTGGAFVLGAFRRAFRRPRSGDDRYLSAGS